MPITLSARQKSLYPSKGPSGRNGADPGEGNGEENDASTISRDQNINSVDDTIETQHQEHEGLWAIGLTFHVPECDRRTFQEAVARTLMPRLIALHDSGSIAAVLPFHHRALKTRGESEGTSWTDYWVLAVAREADLNETWKLIAREASHPGLLRAEILRPQPGLQMFYPRKRGLQQESHLHWIEYAVSRPEAREAYYQNQYRFSAPAIRRFYEAAAVGRVIGFEVARVLENRRALPEWDVIHITGPMHFLKIAWVLWCQMPVFNGFTRDVGHSSALDVVRSWSAQREKYQVHAVQDPTYTLQLANDSSLASSPNG